MKQRTGMVTSMITVHVFRSELEPVRIRDACAACVSFNRDVTSAVNPASDVSVVKTRAATFVSFKTQ